MAPAPAVVPAGLSIRGARDADVPALVDLLVGGALVAGKEEPGNPRPYEDALAEIRSSPGCEVLVAELGGSVVGMCQLIVFRHFQVLGGRCAEIESVHVHPARRGRGIGGALLEAAVSRASTAGCYRAQLTSNRERGAAHRFYERHGFAATHEGFKRVL
jgi:GNAT superfamily N-acetyltransferase